MEDEKTITINTSSLPGDEFLFQCLYDDNNKFGVIRFERGIKEGVRLNKSVRIKFSDIEAIQRFRDSLDFIEKGIKGEM